MTIPFISVYREVQVHEGAGSPDPALMGGGVGEDIIYPK